MLTVLRETWKSNLRSVEKRATDFRYVAPLGTEREQRYMKLRRSLHTLNNPHMTFHTLRDEHWVGNLRNYSDFLGASATFHQTSTGHREAFWLIGACRLVSIVLPRNFLELSLSFSNFLQLSQTFSKFLKPSQAFFNFVERSSTK